MNKPPLPSLVFAVMAIFALATGFSNVAQAAGFGRSTQESEPEYAPEPAPARTAAPASKTAPPRNSAVPAKAAPAATRSAPVAEKKSWFSGVFKKKTAPAPAAAYGSAPPSPAPAGRAPLPPEAAPAQVPVVQDTPQPAGWRKSLFSGKFALFSKKTAKRGGREIAPMDYEQNIGAVGDVELREGDTPFPRHGRYEFINQNGTVNTGLPLPLFEGDALETHENRVQVMLRRPALLGLDRLTVVQLEQIQEVGEVVLSRGRVRLMIPAGGTPWVIHTLEANVFLSPGADVVVDASEALFLRVYALAGGTNFSLPDRLESTALEAGQWAKVPLRRPVSFTAEALAPETADYLHGIFPLPAYAGARDYGSRLAPARAFHSASSLDWPQKDRTLSGVVCPHCAYVFSEGEDAKEYCPHCSHRLQNLASMARCPSCYKPLMQEDYNESRCRQCGIKLRVSSGTPQYAPAGTPPGM